YPKNALQGYNYAMYAMYAGDFDTAIAKASQLQKDDPKFEYNYLPFALSKLAQGDAVAARDAYSRLSQVSPLGASFAALAQAAANLHFGQASHESALLRDGMAADAKNKNNSESARKAVALAEAYLALGQRKEAGEAAGQATALSRAESVTIPA